MESKCLPASSSLHLNHTKNATRIHARKNNHQHNSTTASFFKSRIRYHSKEKTCSHVFQKIYVTQAKKGCSTIEETEDLVKEGEKKGSIVGAVALIIGTTIGSGILALPQKASPAGLIPSSITMILCWAFLLIEALVLIEINVSMRRKKREEGGGGSELKIISITTMAQETLGDWGGTLATLTYVFLGYTSMIAYCSKSGEILFNLINIPESVSGCLFTILLTMLIFVGGTSATDQVNRFLTASMIGLLLAIEVIAVVFGGWSGIQGGGGNWGKVPATIPVMIFSLVYHDLAPVLCAYLGGDIKRLRASVVLGSIIPLFALLVWDAVALGLSDHVDQLIDPVQLLTRVKWSGLSFIVEAFSLIAVGTSLIGTLLGFSEFLKEQLNNFSSTSLYTRTLQQKEQTQSESRESWSTNFVVMAIIVTPTLLVSTSIPHAFAAATDIAGGYCMTMLYGILPPAMGLAIDDREYKGFDQISLTKAKPALFGLGLFASGVVVEQILQDFFNHV